MAAGALSVTLPPAQKLVGPFAEIEGVEGKELTVTTIGSDTAEVQPLLIALTFKLVAFDMVLELSVLPSLHK